MERGNTREVLLLLSDRGYALRLAAALSAAGRAVDCLDPATAALAEPHRGSPCLLVVDASAAAGRALHALQGLSGAEPAPLAWLAAPGTPAPDAGPGVVACIPRPSDPVDCVPALERALALADELAALRAALSGKDRALEEGRTIGIAVGLVMERLHVDRQRAFDALREEARARRLRLGELAAQLLASAELIDGLQVRPPYAAQRAAS